MLTNPTDKRPATPGHGRCLVLVLLAIMGLSPVAAAMAAAAPGRPLAACATVPELASIVREIGGEQVTVEVFTKPTEDPHFTPARPSLIKSLNGCDLFAQIGMELETGWVPLLLRNARNAGVLPGARGSLDASTVITPLDVPIGIIDRSMGDVHPFGNPHFLLDPINGMLVAGLVHQKLIGLRPESRTYFDARLAAFRQQITAALVGETLAGKYDGEKLAILAEHGKLLEFLRSQGEQSALGGWLGEIAGYYGTKVVDDHPLWPYFARRFGLTVVGHLEPKPGFPPTTKHLGDLIAQMRAEHVPVILASAYYDPRHANFVATETGAKVLAMANQAGARPGTDTYIGFIDYNVRQVVNALKG